MDKTINDSEIAGIISHLEKLFIQGRTPPKSIREWLETWFPLHKYEEVYQMVHSASKKLRDEKYCENAKKPVIQYRCNLIEPDWKFHKTNDEKLMLLYSTYKRVGGHAKTQNEDYSWAIKTSPKIAEEMKMIKLPIQQVGEGKVAKLKTDYTL